VVPIISTLEQWVSRSGDLSLGLPNRQDRKCGEKQILRAIRATTLKRRKILNERRMGKAPDEDSWWCDFLPLQQNCVI
jgi:hypothetical protein